MQRILLENFLLKRIFRNLTLWPLALCLYVMEDVGRRNAFRMPCRARPPPQKSMDAGGSRSNGAVRFSHPLASSFLLEGLCLCHPVPLGKGAGAKQGMSPKGLIAPPPPTSGDRREALSSHYDVRCLVSHQRLGARSTLLMRWCEWSGKAGGTCSL